MKIFLFALISFLSLQTAFSQRVEVPTSKKAIAEILKKDREDTRTSKLYFAEADKCRNFVKARDFVKAENSCKLSVTYAENLSEERHLEKSSAYEDLAIVFLWQRKAEEAIILLNKSLEVAKPIIDDTDAETGERYFFLGQANHQLDKIDTAREFYTKAENSYRVAFKQIDDDEIGQHYPKPIIDILEAHLTLLENAGMKEEAKKVEKRLAETKIEFAKYLDK